MTVQIDLSDKTALVMGVANARSLGWAIAEQLLAAGCRVGFSYQGERLRSELDKLLTGRDGVWAQQADATSEEDLTALFARVKEEFGHLDYLIHSIAFAPRTAMDGRFLDTTEADWNTALNVSAYTLVSTARHAEPLLRPGASIVSLTYHASQKVVPKYNVMGVAKAALEATTRYLASEMGAAGVRVNTISAGPMRTIAARSIPGFGSMFEKAAEAAPLGRNATPDEVGKLALFLLSDLGSGVTGQTVYVDAGSSIMAMKIEQPG
ncbi:MULTISPECIES: enoyl-ACP reductase FabI [Deinococcus]|jgi:enoyl-[acyl-carrier protein] reductase I|uniref:enoyl-ACP reductase FabI n=1 Tax=Deinococcus TaxID=1298 RepID=UPI00166D3578|nr:MULTISPECIES: enoyl-ACP reductase [Deinococcus]MDK2012821.1 enoyl-ACP reductase [Deinococcus sp. 43]GGB75012.1 enoyl-[acyl-carrier-protein] reductase [NADH] [Deinococcus soli (ex Cha et al. 2016)]